MTSDLGSSLLCGLRRKGPDGCASLHNLLARNQTAGYTTEDCTQRGRGESRHGKQCLWAPTFC